MPLTDQDARALTYLARRLRTETYGACDWDEAGVWAIVSALVGQQLATSIERVTRHAADPQAKTPGAINRPFVPNAAEPERPRPPKPSEAVCGCGRKGYHAEHSAAYEHDRIAAVKAQIRRPSGGTT